MTCSPWKRCDGSQKQKIAHSICIYAMFIIIGWLRGLFGPSFVDLQFISNTSLKLTSWISTLTFIGYALGCMSGGMLYDKLNRKLIYGTGLLLLGIVTVAIPWCFNFGLMATTHFIQGYVSGVVDTVGNAEMMVFWTDNKMMFFFVEFSYATGAFVAPIFAAPFVLDAADVNIMHRDRNNTSTNGTLRLNLQNDSSVAIVTRDMSLPTFTQALSSTSGNITSGNMTEYIEQYHVTSQLFIPYSITSGLALIACLPFFVRFFIEYTETNDNCSTEANSDVDQVKSTSTTEQTARVLPPKVKVVSLILICCFIFLCLAIAESFMSFIAVYCVDEIGFSPSDGALVTAVSNITSIAAIIVAIFASRLNTLVFLGIHIIGTLGGMLLLLFSSIARTNIGVWISSCIVGYFRAMLFSLTFTWTNNYITPTTGKVSSLFMVCTCTGAAVVPFLLGWLMEEYTNLWFCYLLSLLGGVGLLLYIAGMVLTKYITALYGKTFDTVKSIDIALTEKLNKDNTEENT